MLFLFFSEMSLIILIALVSVKFEVYNLDMNLLYTDSNKGWLFLIPKQIPDYFYKREVVMGVKIATLTACAFFAMPLLLLILVQLKNFCSAQTTNERFSRKKPVVIKDDIRGSDSSADSMSGNLINDDNNDARANKADDFRKKNCVSNCWEMC